MTRKNVLCTIEIDADGARVAEQDSRWLDYDSPEGEPLAKFLSSVQVAVDLIPAERRGQALVSTRGEYDSLYGLDIRIQFSRPETDHEMQAREGREAASEAEREARDRDTFERLKKKFEK